MQGELTLNMAESIASTNEWVEKQQVQVAKRRSQAAASTPTPSVEKVWQSYHENGFTPDPILELVRSVFGGSIGLDPCSDAEAQARVQADTWYDAAAQPLERPWDAQSVWLFPPPTLALPMLTHW